MSVKVGLKRNVLCTIRVFRSFLEYMYMYFSIGAKTPLQNIFERVLCTCDNMIGVKF